LGAVQSTLGVGGCGRKIFALATCSLHFAKASAAALSQQEKNNSADGQRGKSKYIRLYLYSGKLILAATYLRRIFVVGRRFAAGAPALTHVCTVGAATVGAPMGATACDNGAAASQSCSSSPPPPLDSSAPP
jgi:hypothetical protein